MGITDILSLFGGLALFLYGMQMMSTGLEAAAGNKMKSILEKLTSNRIKGVLVGAGHHGRSFSHLLRRQLCSWDLSIRGL